MALDIKDGLGAAETLKTTLDGSDHVPHHHVDSSALPTGAATSANQSTIITSVQLLDDAVATSGSAITAKGFAVSGTDGTNARVLKTDSSGELQVDVLTLPALAAGTNAIGKLAANSGVDIGDVDVTSLPALAAGSNTIGDVGLAGRATGGLSSSTLISAASTNATSVKASAGRVYSIIATNNGAAARYLKMYNKASAPTVGSDTPVATYMLPAGGGICRITDIGLAFSTGIAFAITGGIALSNTSAVSADEVAVNIEYT